MNIAISTNSTWNFIKFRSGLGKSLLKKNHKVFLLSKNDKYKKYIPKNIKFIQIPVNRNPISLINDLQLIFFFLRILKKYEIDLFLGFSHKINIYGGFACRLRNIKCILNLTGLGTAFINNNILKRIIFLLYKLIKFKKSFFLFHNNDDKNLFINNKILNKENCYLVPGSGIKIVRKKIQKINQRSYIIFTFIGRLLVHKGILEFLDAAEKIIKLHLRKNIYFNIIGDIDKSNTTSISKNLILKYKNNKKINFLGFKENVKKYIIKSDCIVLPSYREGLPRVILEALLLERPVITSNVPGCNRIIKNNFNGILCDSKSNISLKNAMDIFLNLPKTKRKKMGINGRKFVENEFNEKKVIDTYLKILKK